jgi:hypothetical protein
VRLQLRIIVSFEFVFVKIFIHASNIFEIIQEQSVDLSDTSSVYFLRSARSLDDSADNIYGSVLIFLDVLLSVVKNKSIECLFKLNGYTLLQIDCS